MSRAVFLILAAVAPLVALWLAAPPDRAAAGLVVSPFGWPSLLAVHVFASVPAGLLLARELVKRVPDANNPAAMVLAGLIAAGVGYAVVGELGAQLVSEAAGFAARTLARSAFCLLLAFPWCVAVVAGSAAGKTDPLVALACAVVALGLPALQADRLADRALTEATELVEKDRIAGVIPLLAVAADVAPDRFSPGGSKFTARQLLDVAAADLKRLSREAKNPPSRPSVEFGTLLLKLDQLQRAEEYLTPLSATNPVARLRLGECLQLQQRWAESEARLRSALAEMLPKADKPHVARWCAECYDLLAESATKRRSNADREAVLRDGRDKLPQFAGYWHLQLGRHFKLSGRPFDALTEFDRAGKADATLKPRLDVLRRDIREHTPGCLVR